MAFRFLHTADLHLDSPLKALALRDPELATEVGVATREALTRLVTLALTEAVDFVLFAGDIWDGQDSSTKTPRFFKQQLLRLDQAGIPSFIIRGNHDAEARRIVELEPPPSTHIFSGHGGTHMLDIRGQSIAIHGLSFRAPHAPESLLPRYPAAVAGAFNIGMMHTSLNGSANHDPYAPCSSSDLAAHGYDYWALGHIHRRAHERIGACDIVMPGTPQGRDMGEAGPKTVTLCDWTREGLTIIPRSVAPLRFDLLPIDLQGLETWADILSALSQALTAKGRAPRPEDHLVLRLILQGDTPLAWRLRRDRDHLAEEARLIASELPSTWIDKIELDLALTTKPAAPLPPELLTLLHEDLPQDLGFAGQLEAIAAEVVDDLPAELRDLFGATAQDRLSLLSELRSEGLAQLLAQLDQTEDM